MDKVTREWIGQGVSCFGVDSTLQSQQLQLGSFAGALLPSSKMHKRWWHALPASSSARTMPCISLAMQSMLFIMRVVRRL